MVNRSDEYSLYTVTLPVTLFVEASSSEKAVDTAMNAILNPVNFHILRNAEIDWSDAKIELGHKFTVPHGN
jgi:hypothetical protein